MIHSCWRPFLTSLKGHISWRGVAGRCSAGRALCALWARSGRGPYSTHLHTSRPAAPRGRFGHFPDDTSSGATWYGMMCRLVDFTASPRVCTAQ